ncbi:MAG: DUF4405 domain-containing protein [Actinomycetota bacterium]|nr:DUF4405 domain-containing protein [Actinomycetota bacterium]
MAATRGYRRIVDIALAALIIVLMSHQLMEDAPHEWIGIGTLALVIVHNLLNRRWYATLAKGPMTATRVLTLVIDLGLIVSFVAAMVSGMAMSTSAVPFLKGLIPMMTARVMHLATTYWCLVFAGLHVGLHLRPAVRTMTKSRGAWFRRASAAAGAALAAFGLLVFVRDGIYRYLTFRAHFALYEHTKPPMLVLVGNAAMLCLFAYISHRIVSAGRSRA